MSVDNAQTHSCPVLQLSPDVWQAHLCRMLNAHHFNALWSCLDRRMQRYLSNLVLDYFSVPSDATRTTLVKTLALRTKRVISIGAKNEKEPILPSSAFGVHALFDDIVEPIMCAQWPNLQSLHLINVGRDDGVANLCLMSVLEKLPPTLTRFVTWDTDYHGGKRPEGPAVDAVTISRAVTLFLPSITELNIITHPLLLPPLDKTCAWPEGLATLALTFEPKEDDSLVLQMILPSTLTDLDVRKSAPYHSDMYPVMRSSLLPRGLVHCRCYGSWVRYDTPLPSSLQTFTCHTFFTSDDNVVNDFATLASTLPLTVNHVFPKPSKEHLPLFSPTIRVGTHANHFVSPPILDADAVDEWNRYEVLKCMDDTIDLCLIAESFLPLGDFNFFGEYNGTQLASLRRHSLLDVFVTRLGKCVTCIKGVFSADVVPLVLKRCPWLSELELASVDASRTFFNHIFDNGPKALVDDRVRVLPHLLQTVSFVADECLADQLISFVSAHPRVQFGLVRGRVSFSSVGVDLVAQMSSACKHLFPNSSM